MYFPMAKKINSGMVGQNSPDLSFTWPPILQRE
ncbi:hypothetical protein AT05_11655 [Schleiferia thermophila str. Yellowstone]|nr:hypothetical protein AT05_11655 [Schleiferia thermophila str. Yellowstone]